MNVDIVDEEVLQSVDGWPQPICKKHASLKTNPRARGNKICHICEGQVATTDNRFTCSQCLRDLADKAKQYESLFDPEEDASCSELIKLKKYESLFDSGGVV